MSDYLTTRELAELLRLGERKVYDLASSGEIPCVRATGKLLFPRAEITAWPVEAHFANPAAFHALLQPLMDAASRAE